jgi:hypothetical protein
MQHYVRVYRALRDSLVERALVAITMQLERDFMIIVFAPTPPS